MSSVRVVVVEHEGTIDTAHQACAIRAMGRGMRLVTSTLSPDYELWFRVCPVCDEAFS